jgi:hypothetical protein
MLKAMMNRITVEFGGKVPVQKEDQDVAPVGPPHRPYLPPPAYGDEEEDGADLM